MAALSVIADNVTLFGANARLAIRLNFMLEYDMLFNFLELFQRKVVQPN